MKVALVTGGAKRIGAAICRALHSRGYAILLHFHSSAESAQILADDLNHLRENSVKTWRADLLAVEELPAMVMAAVDTFGRLDLLVNNASSYFQTPLGRIEMTHWQDLMGTNALAPLVLSKAAAPHLARNQGSIVNITDVNVSRPDKGYLIYTMAKSALTTMTYGLAHELGPSVRVNGVAPGANVWPEDGVFNAEAKEKMLGCIPLGRVGTPEEIASAVCFLADENTYVNGHILAVDGGRRVSR